MQLLWLPCVPILDSNPPTMAEQSTFHFSKSNPSCPSFSCIPITLVQEVVRKGSSPVILHSLMLSITCARITHISTVCTECRDCVHPESKSWECSAPTIDTCVPVCIHTHTHTYTQRPESSCCSAGLVPVGRSSSPSSEPAGDASRP